jgi:hypothetical protein
LALAQVNALVAQGDHAVEISRQFPGLRRIKRVADDRVIVRQITFLRAERDQPQRPVDGA